MKRSKHSNEIDMMLQERTLRKTSIPKEDTWIKSQSLKRNESLSKRLLTDLNSGYKKVFKNWSDFWDMVTDMEPQYCFLCGRFIIPKMRSDTTRIKTPYKNGDVVHGYCWNKEMTVERASGKLNDDAELICHAQTDGAGVVCRERIKNNVEALRHHLGEFHLNEFTHEGNLEFLRAIYTLKPNGRFFRSPII